MKSLIEIILLLLATFIFSVNNSYALIAFEDAIFPELAVSGRALAMGNAFISRVDDSAAAFYNPAGLGSFKGPPRFHLSNFHIEMNKGLTALTTGGAVTDISKNFTKGFSLKKSKDLLKQDKGRMIHSRFALMPNITFRYFSSGFLITKQTRSTIGVKANAKFEYADRLDLGPYLALNISLFGGIIKVGATGMILRRKEIFGESDPATDVKIGDGDYDKGTAMMVISGARLTLPWAMLPTFAATLHNSTSTEFSKDGQNKPTKKPQTLDLGFSLTPQIGKIVRIHLEANYKDSLQKYKNVSTTRRLTLGIEFDIARIIFLRAGYGDGFGSGGIGLRGRHFNFDFTTYAVDTTSSEFRGKEDRRFSLTISSGF